MMDCQERCRGPIITQEDTVVEGWDYRNGVPFPIMGDSRSFDAGEAREILRDLPDGCGDVGVECAFNGYELGFSSGREEGRLEESLSRMDY